MDEKIEFIETPTPPNNEQEVTDLPLFSVLMVVIMFAALIYGGYYFMHKSSMAHAISKSVNAPNTASQ